MSRTVWRSVALLGLGVSLMALRSSAADGDLKVGDKAPDFTMQGSDGKTYTLSQFKGKQAVVIAWFPKAFTGG
jgi:thioredoxin-dependent peroxiredoxin